MKKVLFIRIAGFCIFLVAIALIVYGAKQKHKVYDPETEEFGVELYEDITESQLVIDATFTGTVRKKNIMQEDEATADPEQPEYKLYVTYDRNVKAGKRACPT